MCTTDLRGGTAYLVDGARLGGRRRGTTRFTRLLICDACYERGRPDADTGRTRAGSARRTETTEWWGLAGRGAALPPQACIAGCGLAVVRGAGRLMRGVTCSRACRTTLTRRRNGGRGSGRLCGACGTPVTAGRADSAYCDAACRQKAYRRRAADRAPEPDPDPVPELLTALIPFVNGTTLGISQALYKALYRVHVAHLRGHDPGEFIARLASTNPDRIRIPDTDDGRRLRAALRALGPAQHPHAQP
ncbi:hypothetical protein ACIQRW_38000 [Streptomyces sp. NPDC091287]|uniref:hypothetical protein n=1 Tax=Streptomyces sp. NPDC091287 TaxID=3365988 RepID=UPI003810D0C4